MLLIGRLVKRRFQAVVTRQSNHKISLHNDKTMATITVTPSVGLVDEQVVLAVDGLRPHQWATLSALLAADNVTYMSYGHYTADADGTVDVRTMASEGGTYFGTEPMGLFWSLRLTPDMRPGSRLMMHDVTTPIQIRLMVHDGHLITNDPRNQPVLAETNIERLYLSPDVERIPVQHNNLKATLFVPKAPQQFVGILDLYGSAGGIPEYRASLLASRGFVVLALGYYFAELLQFQSDIEYFEEAVEYLWSHPKVLKTGVGVVGISKGAEIGILLSTVCHKVKAVVSIGGVAWSTGMSHTYKDKIYPHIGTTIYFKEVPGDKYKVRLRKMDEDTSYEMAHTYEGLKYVVHVSRIPSSVVYPVEESKAKFLLLSGDDDCCVPPDADRIITDRLREHGRERDCDVIRYKGTGHLIEPPYGISSRIAYNALYESLFVWGGHTSMHAKAQVDAWARIQSFFRENLGSGLTQSRL